MQPPPSGKVPTIENTNFQNHPVTTANYRLYVHLNLLGVGG